jgi:ribosome-binding ATPase YchF (GTP1/OBG family)
MKIGFIGMNLPEGKTKYKDQSLIALQEKDKPKKVTPFFAQFIADDFVHSDAIVVPSSQILDLLILDMEKIESRLTRVTDEKEKELMEQCMEKLEEEIPLCDLPFSDEEKQSLEAAALCSIKPVVQVEGNEDVNDIITQALEKAGYMFFYTSGPSESHAWLVKKGSTILECAGKIHTDLARGFIKGDIVTLEDYLNCHNFNECKSKGLVKVVDRDCVVEPNEVIEIRFNV